MTNNIAYDPDGEWGTDLITSLGDSRWESADTPPHAMQNIRVLRASLRYVLGREARMHPVVLECCEKHKELLESRDYYRAEVMVLRGKLYEIKKLTERTVKQDV
jgi:hypothetical protein